MPTRFPARLVSRALWLLSAVLGSAAAAQTPAPAKSGIFEAPRLIAGISPEYPPEYRMRQVEGQVTVDFYVNADGTTSDVRAITSPDPRLSRIAEAAVAKWFFAAGTRDGRPVRTHVQVPVVFKALAAARSPAPDPAADPRPADSEGHLAEGAVDMGEGNGAAAVAEFGAAIRLNPDSAEGYLCRARAYALLRREDEALEDYGEAAQLDPSATVALDAYRKSLPDTPERQWAATRYKTFNLVWRTVYETYFDSTFGGIDWLAIREKYRLRLESAARDADLLALLQQMLGELRRTHFMITPREAAVFNPAERVRIGTTGVEVAFVEGAVVVVEVKSGSAGDTAGLKAGDAITRVDDVDIAPTLAIMAKAGLSPARSSLYATGYVQSRLSAAVGTQIKLLAASPGNGPSRPVTVTCTANDGAWSDPIGYFPSQPIVCDVRKGPSGVVYLKFNPFVPPVMKSIRALLRTLDPDGALIIDLRGNAGGITDMASGICGWLCRDEFVLGSMHTRQGVEELTVYPQTHRFDGPVAILIDGRSASSSEILAAGLREKGRARVFGEPSAGAALPSFFKSLPTGDLFQYAVADLTTPSGALLEGTGVAPDVLVPRTRADLAAGRDAPLEAAMAWIATKRPVRLAAAKSTLSAPQ